MLPTSQLHSGFYDSDNLETFTIFWLDASINASLQNIKAQSQLRSIINYLQIFDDADRCEKAIRSLSSDDRLVLIVSGRFGQELVPRIHGLHQLSSVYVYCMNSKHHKKWGHKFSKIRLITSDFNTLIARISSDQQKRVKHDEPLSFLISDRSTGSIDGNFLHSQLLIDTLVRIKPSASALNELVSCLLPFYNGNDHEISMLEEFKNNYVPSQAVFWYSKDSCLYRILNKAFRVQDADMLFNFGFFIRDIQQQLHHLQRHGHKSETSIRLYRGQSMSLDELKGLKKSIGELISMKSFLSTSLKREVALHFLPSSHNIQRVLFEIEANPHLCAAKPFANIRKLSSFNDEDEVLFMPGSIFQISDVRQDDNELWIVQLLVCSDKDQNSKNLFEYMHNEHCKGDSTLLSYGNVLRLMGKLDQAEKFCYRYLNQLSGHHPQIANAYHTLGMITSDQGKYDLSLAWFDKALNLYKLAQDHILIADSMSNIALTYYNKEDYEQAIKSYNNALIIYNQELGQDHEKVATCYDGMGAIYGKLSAYSKSLVFKQKALSIREKYLPANHPDLGQSNTCMGTTYNALGDFKSALLHYCKSLEIYKNSIPSDHPRFAMTYKNMGITYENMGQLRKAKHYYKKTAKIYEHLFSSDHPDVIDITEKLSRISRIILLNKGD